MFLSMQTFRVNHWNPLANNRIIFGIDPGSVKTGWGAIKVAKSEVSIVDHGVIHLGSADLPSRLMNLHAQLSIITERIKPTEFAIEEVFLAKNFQSALKLGQARGVALLAAGKTGVSFREFAAKTVKKAICGRGQASKYQMQQMIMKILRLAENPGEDASDALGIALCAAYAKEGTHAEARFRLSTRSRSGSRWRLKE